MTNKLAPRELEILRMVVNGATNREIAEKLVISPHTVKATLCKIVVKLDARSVRHAVALGAVMGYNK